MNTTLRLDPSHPPLWRNERELQLGITDAPVISDPRPWQLELIHALEYGFPRIALPQVAAACGARVSEARAFLTSIDVALMHERERVDLAVALVENSADHERARAFAAALESAGARITPDAGIVVVLTPYALVPRTTTTWMSEDRPHLPVVVDGSGITVGPVILPGVTACAACLAAERREADPSWPAVLAQVLDRTPPLIAAPTYALAAPVVLELLTTIDTSTARSRAIRIDAANRRSETTHLPHADCGCRSPEGIVTACASLALPRAATTAPASAQLA